MSQTLVSNNVGPEVIYLVFQHPRQSVCVGSLGRWVAALSC